MIQLVVKFRVGSLTGKAAVLKTAVAVKSLESSSLSSPANYCSVAKWYGKGL